MPTRSNDPLPPSSASSFNRKVMLEMIGSVGGLFVLNHCSGGGSSPTTVASTTATATPTATASAGSSTSSTCTTTLEGEIGPYFAGDSASGFNRSNITANVDGTDVQSGVPLTLNVYVVDTEKSCAAYVGAQVDIWHCNANGIYSDISSENTTGDSYLRGYQLTDSAGYVQFVSIVPGWYAGRTTHIHLRVRSSYNEASSKSDGSNTTQVFFPQTMNDYLSTNVSPYDSEGKDSTTNTTDRVYESQTKGLNQLTLLGSYSGGFSATFTIGLPIGG